MNDQINENTSESKIPNNSDKIIDQKNTIEKGTSHELVHATVSTPRQCADIAIKILRENFSTICDIVQDKGLRYFLNRKGLPRQGTIGQMMFTITGDGRINIELTVYGTTRKYRTTGLSNDDFLAEIDTLTSFLSDDILPSPTSKILKIKTADDYNQEYASLSAGDKDISKPIIHGLKNVKETINTIPELTKEYYKIPSLSEEQKHSMHVGESIEGWIKENIVGYIRTLGDNGFPSDKKTSITLIRKYIPGKASNAYVREYIDGVPEEINGLQMFNESAVRNLGIHKWLPSRKDLMQMVGDRRVSRDRQSEMAVAFCKENRLHSTGSYDACNNRAIFIGSKSFLWLKGYRLTTALGSDFDYEPNNLDKNHGYPVMLMKNK